MLSSDDIVTIMLNIYFNTINYRSRTITRSVNKGVKGDLPSAMEKQVTRCDEPVEPLLKLFFKNEHLDIS